MLVCASCNQLSLPLNLEAANSDPADLEQFYFADYCYIGVKAISVADCKLLVV